MPTLQDLYDVSRGVQEGATFGAGKYVEAAIRSLMNRGMSYDQALELVKAKQAEVQERNPGAYYSGELAGGFLPGVVAAPLAIAAQLSKGVGAARAAASGLSLGALSGMFAGKTYFDERVRESQELTGRNQVDLPKAKNEVEEVQLPDTFRHAYASALTAQAMPKKLASVLGYVNEYKAAIRPYAEPMAGMTHEQVNALDIGTDLYNNDVGFKIAKDLGPKATKAQIKKAVEEAMRDGRLITDIRDPRALQRFNSEKGLTATTKARQFIQSPYLNKSQNYPKDPTLDILNPTMTPMYEEYYRQRAVDNLDEGKGM